MDNYPGDNDEWFFSWVADTVLIKVSESHETASRQFAPIGGRASLLGLDSLWM